MNDHAKAGGGFTLVEVILALGIVSFCSLAIVGLLPVGMNSIRNTRNEIAAASVAQWVSNSIRNASGSGTTYAALGSYTGLSWSIGGAVVTKDFTNLSREGTPASNILDQQFDVHVQIAPPADLSASGTAFVTVAWPTQAQWDTDNRRWINAQGSVSTWIVFLPRQ